MAADIARRICEGTRRRFTTEDKIRIVLEELREEIFIAELCRKERIHPSLYYNWSKAFLEAEPQKAWVGGIEGPSSDGKSGLERDSASGTRQGVRGGVVASGMVFPRGELLRDG